MATEAKEGVKLHTNTISSPSTPRRPGSAPAERQTASKPPEHCTAADAQDKPIPNYLRPTVSSCRSTGRQAPPPSASPKSPVAKKPVVDRAKSSSSLLKERPSKPSSPLPRPSVASKPKNARTPILSKSKSFSKAGIDAAKKREGKQEERAIAAAAALSKSSSFSRISTSGVTKKIEPRQEVKIKEPVELKNEEKEEEEEEKPKVAEAEMNASKVERAVVLRRQESKGRESSQPYNEVIEETANKLAAERRNKVKALVGAFETVISLQEPEGQQSQSPQKGETKVTSPSRESTVNIVKSDRIEENETKKSVEVEVGIQDENMTKINEKEHEELSPEEKTDQVKEENKELAEQDEINHASQDNVQNEKIAIVEGSQHLTRSTDESNAGEGVSNATTESIESTEEKNSAEKDLVGSADDGQL